MSGATAARGRGGVAGRAAGAAATKGAAAEAETVGGGAAGAVAAAPVKQQVSFFSFSSSWSCSEDAADTAPAQPP